MVQYHHQRELLAYAELLHRQAVHLCYFQFFQLPIIIFNFLISLPIAIGIFILEHIEVGSVAT